MHKLPNNDAGSKNFDGKKLARQFYAPPDAPEGDGAKTKPPPEYNDLFDPPALSEAAGETLDESPPPREEVEGRVPFDPHLSFYELRRRCIAAGEKYGKPYEGLLTRLRGVEPLARHEAEESRGASYKRLCTAAHMAGFSTPARKNLYVIAERVGMSDRFAGHLIASLKHGGGDGR